MKPRKESFLSAITTIPSASVLGILSVALGVASSPTFAASADWTGLGADSAWTTTGNWSTTPVPGSGDTATFNGSGNGKTTITTAPAALTRYVFDTASAAAYTISGASTTWSVPNGGGVTVNSTVTTNQNLSGIQFIRPASGTTTAFINDAANTTLRLGTIFNSNTSNGNARLNFSPASGATIELISGKLIDNANASRTTSVLINTPGTFKMAGVGGFSGTDGDGNSVTIRQGTFMASVIANASATVRTSLGTAGRIQFGYGTTANTATLDYYGTANAVTDRAFHIIDNATAVFKVSGGAGTNLELTTGITQSASTNGGGKLTKEGVGRLTLSGSNTYTGATSVNAGTLSLGNGSANTGLADTSDVIIAAGATLDLNFSAANVDEVKTLTINGVQKATGVWGAPGSGAPKTDPQLTGTGYLKVTSGPPADDYTEWANSFTPPVGQASADDDNDSLSNFGEYAFGLNPQSAASVNPITQPPGKSTGQFKYTRRATPGTTGVTYTYGYSTTLDDSWPGFTPDVEVSNYAIPVEEITVTLPAGLLANPSLFLRVQAAKP